MIPKIIPIVGNWCRVNQVLFILISIFCISMTLWALIPHMMNGNRYWSDIGFHLRFAKDIIILQEIPLYTPWFNGGQPYVYPPLTHILTAVLSIFVPISTITLFNFLIIGISFFGVFPIYLLTKRITNDTKTSIFAAFIYAFSPLQLETIDISANHVAIFFMLLFCLSFIRTFEINRNRDAVLAGIFLGIQPYVHTLSTVVMAFWYLPILLIIKLLPKKSRMAKLKNTILTFFSAGFISLPYFHHRTEAVEFSKSLLNTAEVGSALPESLLSIISRFVVFGKGPAHLFNSDEFFLLFVGLGILSMSFFAIIYTICPLLTSLLNKKTVNRPLMVIPIVWFILLFIASIGYKINISFVPGSYRYYLFLIIPSSILSAVFIIETIQRFKNTNKIRPIYIIPLLLLVIMVPVIQPPIHTCDSIHTYDYSWSQDEINDMEWLKNNTPDDATIASWYITGVAIPYVADRKVPFAMTGTIANADAIPPLRELLFNNNINDADIVNNMNKLNATYIFEKKAPLIKYHETIWAGITHEQYNKYNSSKVLKKIYETDNFVAFQLVQNLSLNIWGEYDVANGKYNLNNFNFLLHNTFLTAPKERWDLTAEYAISTHPISYFRFAKNLDNNQDYKTDYPIQINISYLDNSYKAFEVYAIRSGTDSGDFQKAPPLKIAKFEGTNSDILKTVVITIPKGSEIKGQFFVKEGLYINFIEIKQVE